MSNSGMLKGRNSICSFLDIGKAIFYRLINQGLPVKKVGNSWRGHQDVLEKWFKDFVENEEGGSSGPGDR
jgi:hypothetical protein